MQEVVFRILDAGLVLHTRVRGFEQPGLITQAGFLDYLMGFFLSSPSQVLQVFLCVFEMGEIQVE